MGQDNGLAGIKRPTQCDANGKTGKPEEGARDECS